VLASGSTSTAHGLSCGDRLMDDSTRPISCPRYLESDPRWPATARRQAYARDHLSGHPPDPEARCGISGSDSGCLLMCQVSCRVILVCELFSRPRYDMEDIMNSIHDVALYATGSRSNLTRTRRRDHYSPSLSSSTRGWSRQSAPASMRRAPLISNMASWHRHQWPAGSGRCPQHAASRAGRVSRRALV
jgi:hypothetical protein